MRGLGLWRWQKPAAGLAFTDGAVVALRHGDDGGLPRYYRAELPAGLVDVSVTTPNVQSMSELAQIVEGALDAVGAPRERLALALPDLAVTTALLPRRGGASERDLKHELAATLPFALGDARYDFWRGRHDEVLAAAVRDVVAGQYEEVVEAAGRRLAWVDAVSLVTIPSWSARSASNGEIDVDVQLYRGHYSLIAFRGGELVDARTKLRTSGDVELVSREVLRVPALHGDEDAIDSLTVAGAGADALAEALEDSAPVRSIRVASEDEDRHLQSAIEMLIARGSV